MMSVRRRRRISVSAELFNDPDTALDPFLFPAQEISAGAVGGVPAAPEFFVCGAQNSIVHGGLSHCGSCFLEEADGFPDTAGRDRAWDTGNVGGKSFRACVHHQFFLSEDGVSAGPAVR